jgi:threonine/homoserine/homoserine lactone efflux protein
MVDAFLKGLLISLFLIFSVGPVIFTTIKQTINHGRRGGFSFVVGVWVSDIIWIILSNGFSEVIKKLLVFEVPIGIAGCCFLMGMGIYFVFFKKVESKRLREPAEIAGDVYTPTGKKTNYFAIMSSGFIINTINPGVISFWVFWSASLAPDYSFYERIIIFITCLAINILADVGKVMGAGYIRKKLNDRVILIINRVSGLLYLIFGLVLLAGIIYKLIKH